MWNHNPQSNSGPLRWGNVAPSNATCGTAPDLTGKAVIQVGMKQTPINIDSTKATPGLLPALTFRYLDSPLEVENTGHVVEVHYAPGSSLLIGKSPTDDYKLVQFHFHAPSEHTVDGKSYDAELHLVHTNILGEIAVVGILLNKISSDLNKTSTATAGIYQDVVSTAPMKGGSAHPAGRKLNAKDLLPASKSYYSYTGSLTTPPCSESVRWFVLTKPVEVSDAVIRQLHSLIAAFPGYEGYQNNNRPLAPLNGRPVVLVR